MIYKKHLKSRSQDLTPAYHDAGQFYWMRFERGLNGNNKLGFEVSPLNVQDIDTLEDWMLAEMKYKLSISNAGN